MIKYTTVMRKNPINKEVNYYATMVPVVPMDFDQLVQNIADSTTLTEADLRAAFAAAKGEIIKALRDGKSVRLDQLGTFRPTIASDASVSREEVSAKNIKRVRVVFTPSTAIKEGLSLTSPYVTFTKVNAAEPEAAV